MLQQHLLQLQGIDRRGALLVVIEEYEHVVPLCFPRPDALGPCRQGIFRVVPFISPTGTMTSDIDKVRRPFPGCRRVMMVGDAQRDVLLREKAHDGRRIPAGMAKLETVASFGRKHPKEG